jgi:lipoprotein Spr
MNSLRIFLWLCCLFGFQYTALASTSVPHHPNKQANKYLAVKPAKTAANLKRRKRLMREYQHWKGTRYRLGANSHKAIDCSALTRRLYRDAFAVNLPRTTGGQINRGKKARQKTLRIGDLLFFKTGRAQRHVGIYIGEDRFIHASSRKGVTISLLSNPYWASRIIAARRVLTETTIR